MEVWMLDDQQWEEFWNRLEAPVKELPKLKALFERPNIFEEVS